MYLSGLSPIVLTVIFLHLRLYRFIFRAESFAYPAASDSLLITAFLMDLNSLLCDSGIRYGLFVLKTTILHLNYALHM